MKNLLVTGISGFLGWHLYQVAQNQSVQNQSVQNQSVQNQAASTAWQVYGSFQTHPVFLPGARLLRTDLTDRSQLRSLFKKVQPDAVIHAAALSQPNACQNNPDLSYQINVLASWQIAELCAEAGIPCVFTSSEQVFDGWHAPYHETDPVCPVNLYGEHKVAAEVGMQERYADVTICRMPLMFGAAPTAPSFIQPFINILRSGQPLNAFTDEIRTPLSGFDAAEGLLLMLEKAKGIVHLGGPARLSRYEMAQLLVEILDISTAQINPCRQADVPMPAPRPPDLTLDSSRATSLGYQPRSMREALMAIKELL